MKKTAADGSPFIRWGRHALRLLIYGVAFALLVLTILVLTGRGGLLVNRILRTATVENALGARGVSVSVDAVDLSCRDGCGLGLSGFHLQLRRRDVLLRVSEANISLRQTKVERAELTNLHSGRTLALDRLDLTTAATSTLLAHGVRYESPSPVTAVSFGTLGVELELFRRSASRRLELPLVVNEITASSTSIRHVAGDTPSAVSLEELPGGLNGSLGSLEDRLNEGLSRIRSTIGWILLILTSVLFLLKLVVTHQSVGTRVALAFAPILVTVAIYLLAPRAPLRLLLVVALAAAIGVAALLYRFFYRKADSRLHRWEPFALDVMTPLLLLPLLLLFAATRFEIGVSRQPELMSASVGLTSAEFLREDGMSRLTAGPAKVHLSEAGLLVASEKLVSFDLVRLELEGDISSERWRDLAEPPSLEILADVRANVADAKGEIGSAARFNARIALEVPSSYARFRSRTQPAHSDEPTRLAVPAIGMKSSVTWRRNQSKEFVRAGSLRSSNGSDVHFMDGYALLTLAPERSFAGQLEEIAYDNQRLGVSISRLLGATKTESAQAGLDVDDAQLRIHGRGEYAFENLKTELDGLGGSHTKVVRASLTGGYDDGSPRIAFSVPAIELASRIHWSDPENGHTRRADGTLSLTLSRPGDGEAEVFFRTERPLGFTAYPEQGLVRLPSQRFEIFPSFTNLPPPTGTLGGEVELDYATRDFRYRLDVETKIAPELGMEGSRAVNSIETLALASRGELSAAGSDQFIGWLEELVPEAPEILEIRASLPPPAGRPDVWLTTEGLAPITIGGIEPHIDELIVKDGHLDSFEVEVGVQRIGAEGSPGTLTAASRISRSDGRTRVTVNLANSSSEPFTLDFGMVPSAARLSLDRLEGEVHFERFDDANTTFDVGLEPGLRLQFNERSQSATPPARFLFSLGSGSGEVGLRAHIAATSTQAKVDVEAPSLALEARGRQGFSLDSFWDFNVSTIVGMHDRRDTPLAKLTGVTAENLGRHWRNANRVFAIPSAEPERVFWNIEVQNLDESEPFVRLEPERWRIRAELNASRLGARWGAEREPLDVRFDADVRASLARVGNGLALEGYVPVSMSVSRSGRSEHEQARELFLPFQVVLAENLDGVELVRDSAWGSEDLDASSFWERLDANPPPHIVRFDHITSGALSLENFELPAEPLRLGFGHGDRLQLSMPALNASLLFGRARLSTLAELSWCGDENAKLNGYLRFSDDGFRAEALGLSEGEDHLAVVADTLDANLELVAEDLILSRESFRWRELPQSSVFAGLRGLFELRRSSGQTTPGVVQASTDITLNPMNEILDRILSLRKLEAPPRALTYEELDVSLETEGLALLVSQEPLLRLGKINILTTPDAEIYGELRFRIGHPAQRDILPKFFIPDLLSFTGDGELGTRN